LTTRLETGRPFATGVWSGNWLVAAALGDRLVPTASVAGNVQAPGSPTPSVTPPEARRILLTPNIVAFGDSVTAGSHSASLVIAEAEPNHVNYPAYLASLLASRYTQPPTIRVTNSGVPGELALDGKDRIGSVLDSVRPNLVLILEGVNDINASRNVAQIAADIQTMVSRAQARGVRILLARLPPVTINHDPNGTVQEQIRQLNARIDTISNQAGLGSAVDLYNALTFEMIGNDGLHPNDAGYQQIGRTFFDAIVQRFEVNVRAALAADRVD
jgi:lysophospholipase L1-like esterase